MKQFTSVKALENYVKKDVRESMGKAIAAIDKELDRVIESENEFADMGFREQDIIDTSRLLNSKVINANPDGVTFTYDPVSPENGYHYGPAVYFGFFAWGRKYIPGRRWTVRAAKNENPTVAIAKSLKAKGYNARIIVDHVPDMVG